MTQFVERPGHVLVLSLVPLGLFALAVPGTITLPRFPLAVVRGLHPFRTVLQLFYNVVHAEMFEVLDRRPEVVHPPLKFLGGAVMAMMPGTLMTSPLLIFHVFVDLVQQTPVPFELTSDLVPFPLVGVGLFEFIEVSFQFVDPAFHVVGFPLELFACLAMATVPVGFFFEPLRLVLEPGGLISPPGRLGAQTFDFDLALLR
ncbi:MAG: hypothetical protein ACF8TS_12575 [Maioricimonas sp. JB049]